MHRVVLLALIWGWSFLLIKVSLGGMTPATVAFGRVALGMVVMLCVLRASGAALPRDRRSWRHFTVMGLLYSAVPFTLLAWAEQHITSALTAVVNASTGLFTAVAAAVGLAERLRRPQLAGLAVGFTGVAVAAGLSGRDLTSSSYAGIAAALGASACYGVSFVYAKRNLAATPPLVAACGQLVAAVVLSSVPALVTSARDGFSPSARQALAITVLGVVGTGIAYVLIYRSIADVGPTVASLVTYLVPAVAVTVGVVFLDEPFHLRLLVGGALTVAGIALVQGRFRLQRSRPLPAAAAVLALLLLMGCGGGGDGDDAGGTTSSSRAACGADVREPLDPNSTRHLLPGAPEPTYATDPPTSGAHLAGELVTGVRTEPLPRPVQVAVLEAGGVVIQHRGLGDADRRRLEALAGVDVVVAPNPTLPAPVVATAWLHRLTCDGAGPEAGAALASFVRTHVGRGPEH